MDPLHLSIALGPLAVYLLLVGMINLGRRPLLTTGARDTAALGLAISGFAVAGPMELFLPEAAASHFGSLVWLLLIGFYVMCLTLIVLLTRPRLIIYNIPSDQLRPILAQVVGQLDHEARWAGASLVMPRLGVHLSIESFTSMKNAQLVSAGPLQSYAGWRRLEKALAQSLTTITTSRNHYGFSLLFFGLLLVFIVTLSMVGDSETVHQSLQEMLRR